MLFLLPFCFGCSWIYQGCLGIYHGASPPSPLELSAILQDGNKTYDRVRIRGYATLRQSCQVENTTFFVLTLPKQVSGKSDEAAVKRLPVKVLAALTHSETVLPMDGITAQVMPLSEFKVQGWEDNHPTAVDPGPRLRRRYAGLDAHPTVVVVQRAEPSVAVALGMILGGLVVVLLMLGIYAFLLHLILRKR